MKNTEQTSLVYWFRENKRSLPWRKTKNPYKIWISETMLQQTTSQAVIPYYKKFLASFPSIKALAEANESQVLEAWAGLGYYSRARNLHKAAKLLLKQSHFPQSYQDLIRLPGFGPYTSRSVSSLAFSEAVGVVDGNVIRFISRFYNTPYEWWKTLDRQKIQEKVDQLVQGFDSGEMNQALMELGATICLPKSPKCFSCPLVSQCKGKKTGQHIHLPLTKPKKEKEIWVWQPNIVQNKNRIALIANNYAPFLKGQYIFPGKIKKQINKPKKYSYKHSITHYDIYVILKKNINLDTPKDALWVEEKKVKQLNPASLLTKALSFKL